MSNLVLKAEEKSWKVHKVVVAAQSTYLAKECRSRVHGFLEQHEIKLKDVPAEDMDRVISFFYDQQCHPEGLEDNEGDIERMKGHLRLLDLCNRVSIAGLKQELFISLRSVLEGPYSSQIHTRVRPLPRTIIEFITLSSRKPQDTDKNFNKLLTNTRSFYLVELMDREDFRSILAANHAFAFNVLQRTSDSSDLRPHIERNFTKINLSDHKGCEIGHCGWHGHKLVSRKPSEESERVADSGHGMAEDEESKRQWQEQVDQ